jgi:hypothetical protein
MIEGSKNVQKKNLQILYALDFVQENEQREEGLKEKRRGQGNCPQPLKKEQRSLGHLGPATPLPKLLFISMKVFSNKKERK